MLLISCSKAGLSSMSSRQCIKSVAKSFGYLTSLFVLVIKKKKVYQKWSAVSPHWYAYSLPKNFVSDLDVDVVHKKFD